jgi:hypothetical protein
MRDRISATVLAVLSFWLFLPTTVKADEPTPGAARISLIRGDVSTMRGDTGQWAATTVNAPLVQGDSISTGERSRTEIQLDYANILRLDQSTEAKIADLTRAHIQVQVASGRVSFTVLKSAEAQVEIDTPNMAVHPLGEGEYRIQVNSPSETQVTVRRGGAEVSTQQGNTTVEKDQTIYVKGTDNPEYRIVPAEAKDEWDEWNSSRDHAIQSAQSWGYTNRYYTGAEDLDRYGHWDQAPDYGSVWVPDEGPDWVPYREGTWEWEPYWGWTWVSYEPWGWAPYHYGRWTFWGNRWCWWPGFVTAGFYPAWGPAWVSFLGFGFGHSVGFGFGFNHIGWCPLGPYDSFSPWWGRRNTYNVVNITNINNVTNITNAGNIGIHRYVGNAGGRYVTNLQAALTNPRVRSAVTVVAANQMGNGRVATHVMTADPAGLRQAHVIQGTLPVVPTAQSLRAVDRPVNRAALPSPAANAQRFFSKQPTPAAPASFHEQAAQIQRMVQTHNPLAAGNANTQAGVTNGNRFGRAVPPTAAGNGRPAATGGAQPARTASGQVVSGGSARGTPAQGATTSGSFSTRTQTAPTGRPVPSGVPSAEGGGWRRFGGSQPAPGTSVPSQNNNGGRYPPTVTLGGSSPRTSQPTPQAGGRPSGWARFSETPNSGRPAPSTGGGGQTAGRGSTPQQRPAPSQQSTSGWSRFTAQPRVVAPSRSGGWNAPAPSGGRPESPWRSGPSYRAAPSGYGRPPLDLRRPIVTERAPAPRIYGGGGSRGWPPGPQGGGYRGGSAPSGGGSRGGSAPSGGGHSAPAPSSGGHHGGSPKR